MKRDSKQPAENARKARTAKLRALREENQGKGWGKVKTVITEPWSGKDCEGYKNGKCAGRKRTVNVVCKPCQAALSRHHEARNKPATYSL